MEMTILIIDNRTDDDAIKNMKMWIADHFPNFNCKQITSSEFDPKDITNIDPKIVILDIGLTQDEEDYFDDILNNSTDYDPKRKLSGIDYCYKLKTNFANIPVILASRFFHGDILAQSIKAGADGFIYKDDISEKSIIPALKTAYYKHKTKDIALYEQLRALLVSSDSDAWEKQHMLFGLDDFFSYGSGTRRLTGLWCHLASIIERILPHEIVFELLKALMDTEALLLAANPKMRDHLSHSGNVFWLGYFLLNSIEHFKDPKYLPGHVKNVYAESDEFSYFEQLNISWVLCSLLHDIGYLREKLHLVHDRMSRGYKLFSVDVKDSSPPTDNKILENLNVLQGYLQKLNSDGKLIYTAIDTIANKIGKKSSDGKTVQDHGLYSASAFIASIKKQDKDALKKPEILHAATAIALHNLPKWNKSWLSDSMKITPLHIGLLPCAWLLAYVDELQGWGREIAFDSFEISEVKNLMEALRKSRDGYMIDSRISSFKFSSNDSVLLERKIKLTIQFMMVHGQNSMIVSNELKMNIEKWKRDYSNVLKETLDLENLIKTEITYKVPGPIEEDIFIPL